MISKLQKKVLKVASGLDYVSYKADLIKHAGQLPQLSEGDRTVVDRVREEGTHKTSLDALAIPSTPKMLEAATNILPELLNIPTKKNRAYSRANAEQLVQYPELYLWGLEGRLLDIIESYLGLPAAYHGVSFRRDAADGSQQGTRQWHIDIEDRRMAKIIVYFNEVGADNGPYEYISKSLTPPPWVFKRNYGFIEDAVVEKAVPPSKWTACTGAAGTAVFTDTCAVFHRGRMPLVGERLAMFFTYTSRRPKHPEDCKSILNHEQLVDISQSLSERQKQCIFWQQGKERSVKKEE